MTNFADRVIQRLRDILVFGICERPDKLFDCGADILAVIEQQKKLFTPAWIAYCIDTLTAAVADAKTAKNVRVVYELALIRLCDENFDSSASGLLARMEAIEAQLSGGVPMQAVPERKAPPRIEKPAPTPTTSVQPEPIPIPTPVEEAPPWEEAPLPEPPAEEPTPIVPPTPVPTPKATPIKANGAWGDVLTVLKKSCPPMFGALSGKKQKIAGDCLYLINEFYIKAIVGANEDALKSATAQVFGAPLRVIYLSEAEFDGITETLPAVQATPAPAADVPEMEDDPLDALLQFSGADIEFEN